MLLSYYYLSKSAVFFMFNKFVIQIFIFSFASQFRQSTDTGGRFFIPDLAVEEVLRTAFYS